MKINDLSPEEKIRFEEFKNLWKEGTGFYWRIAILLFFFWPLWDIIPTLIFVPFGGPINGYLPSIPFNMNNIAQLCYQFSVFCMMFGFFISWMCVKEAKRKKLATVLVIIIWAAWFAYIASMEDWIKDTLLRQIIMSAQFLICLAITTFLAIKVKWPRFIWVITAYLGVLLVLYYGCYYPLASVSVNPWPSPPSLSNPPSGTILGYIPPVLGIISAVFMAWASSEKGQKWAAFSHILEERKKKRK